MDKRPGCETRECRSGPFSLEARLNRLEGLLYHLMNDLMDALVLLAGAKEAAGLARDEPER